MILVLFLYEVLSVFGVFLLLLACAKLHPHVSC